MSIRDAVPWWGRLGAKLVLSRVPLGYPLWRRLNVFRHGDMLDAQYALDVFRRHVATAERLSPGFVMLELGPGDSVLSGVIARLAGASRSYLVDAGAFAQRDVAGYRRTAERLQTTLNAFDSINPAKWRTFADVLDDCHITYGMRGLESLRAISDAVVDLSYSQAVLEHVRRAEFGATIRELRRVAKPGGTSSHQVDLRDHLGGALNNLRFRDATWEHEFFASSGFYTNRLRYSEILECAAAAGFRVERVEPHLWERLPTPRERLDSAFAQWSDDELRIMDFFLVLRAA